MAARAERRALGFTDTVIAAIGTPRSRARAASSGVWRFFSSRAGFRARPVALAGGVGYGGARSRDVGDPA